MVKKRYTRNRNFHREKLEKRHHRIKLATLFTSKLLLSLISFTAGLYIGTFTGSTFATLLVAFGLAAITYLLTIINVIDYLGL